MIQKHLNAIHYWINQGNPHEATNIELIESNIGNDWSLYKVLGSKFVFIQNRDGVNFKMTEAVVNRINSEFSTPPSDIVIICNQNKKDNSNNLLIVKLTNKIEQTILTINFDKPDFFDQFERISYTVDDSSIISKTIERYAYLITAKKEKIEKEHFKFSTFYNFFAEKYNNGCDYCHITEENISTLFKLKRIRNKHSLKSKTRGFKLEFDRKESEEGKNVYSFGACTNESGATFDERYEHNNIVLSCYWCNQAKMDEYSYDEFKIIGEAIEKIWKNRLKQ